MKGFFKRILNYLKGQKLSDLSATSSNFSFEFLILYYIILCCRFLHSIVHLTALAIWSKALWFKAEFSKIQLRVMLLEWAKDHFRVKNTGTFLNSSQFKFLLNCINSKYFMVLAINLIFHKQLQGGKPNFAGCVLLWQLLLRDIELIFCT